MPSSEAALMAQASPDPDEPLPQPGDVKPVPIEDDTSEGQTAKFETVFVEGAPIRIKSEAVDFSYNPALGENHHGLGAVVVKGEADSDSYVLPDHGWYLEEEQWFPNNKPGGGQGQPRMSIQDPQQLPGVKSELEPLCHPSSPAECKDELLAFGGCPAVELRPAGSADVGESETLQSASESLQTMVDQPASPCCPEPSLAVKSESADGEPSPPAQVEYQQPYKGEFETEELQIFDHGQTGGLVATEWADSLVKQDPRNEFTHVSDESSVEGDMNSSGEGNTAMEKSSNCYQQSDPFESSSCWQCQADFQSWHQLEQHTASQHPGSKAHHCAECGETFTHVQAWKQHSVSAHCTQSTFQCRECGMEFSYQYLLQQHARVHSTARPFACKECGASFKEKRNLQQNICTLPGKKLHKCTVCGRGFAHLWTMQRHHSTHNGEKPHRCTVCGRGFALLWVMQRHHSTHTGEKPHRCTVCGCGFARLCTLQVHQRTHTGEKPHQCTVCGRGFAQQAHLLFHQKTHTGEKPHLCTVCGCGFARLSDVRRHQSTHTGEKPHQCTECGRGFVQQTHLLVHQKTHTGEKPHQCEVCGKAFARSGNLRSHVATVHRKEQQQACSRCSKNFSTAQNLKRHVQSVHLV